MRFIDLCAAAILAAAGLVVAEPAVEAATPLSRRADLLAAGVDPMPVGTARQVERARRLIR